MKAKRKQHSPSFKAKVALDALKEKETLAELSKRYEIHPTMIGKWNRTADAAGFFGASGLHIRKALPSRIAGAL